MVNPVQIPGVSISASDTDICAGTRVTFIATGINGGLLPSYQWKQNGTDVGTDSTNFTTNTLHNGDVVSLSLTSSAVCADPIIVSSNSIAVSVNSVTPSLSITGEATVMQDSIALVSSSITNGGNLPAYQWQDSTAKHSWLNIKNATSSAINYTPVKTGDKIRCILTSNAACATNATTISNTLAFTVDVAVTPTPTTVPANNKVKLYPNPVTAILTIDSLGLADGWETLQLVNMNGLQHIITKSITGLSKVSINVEELQSGVYVAILRRQRGNAAYFKFIKL